MSSRYPPDGGFQYTRCQNCGAPLAPNTTQCSYCQYNNSPRASNNPPSRPQPDPISWNGTALSGPTSQGSNAPQTEQGLRSGMRQNNPPSNPWQQPNPPSNPWQSQSGRPGENFQPFSNPGNPTWLPERTREERASEPGLSHPGIDGRQGSRPGFWENNASNPSSLPAGFIEPATSSVASRKRLATTSTGKKSEKTGFGKSKIIISVTLILILLLAGGTYLYVKGGAKPGSGTDQQSHTPTAYPTPKASPLFSETFKDNSQNWDLQSMPGKYTVVIDKNAITLEDSNNKIFPVLLPGEKAFDNFQLFVDARLDSGDPTNGYGVCIRGKTDNTGNLIAYYRLELYNNGTYTIVKEAIDENGHATTTTLAGNATSSAIHTNKQKNQIVVLARQSKISLIVNGQILQQITDTAYTSGQIGLFVSNVPGAKPGATASFSNLAVYAAK